MLMWIIPILLLLALLWDRSGDRRQSAAPCILTIAGLLVLPGLGVVWMGGMHGFGYDLPRWTWVGGVLLLVAVGVSGYMALRPDRRESEELQILKLRLVRGEISPEEYDLLYDKLRG